MPLPGSDFVRKCPHCDLVYEPDPRIYKDPDIFCPRCGRRLIRETDTQGES